MINLKTLEELRSKEEVLDYFKQLGKEITEEEIDTLKQSYEKVQESNGALTLDQLDDVVGGNITIIIKKTSDGKRCRRIYVSDDFNVDMNLAALDAGPGMYRRDKKTVGLYERSCGADSWECIGSVGFTEIHPSEDYKATRNSHFIIGSTRGKMFGGKIYESTGDPEKPWKLLSDFARVKTKLGYKRKSKGLDDKFSDPNRITVVLTESLDDEKDEYLGSCTFNNRATICSVLLEHAKMYFNDIEMACINWVIRDIEGLNEEARPYFQDLIDALEKHGLVDHLNPSVNPDGLPAKRQKTQ